VSISPEGPRRKWDNNIKTDLREANCEDVNCVELATGRVQYCWAFVNTVPLKQGAFFTS